MWYRKMENVSTTDIEKLSKIVGYSGGKPYNRNLPKR
jgi:hypothetical protein